MTQHVSLKLLRRYLVQLRECLPLLRKGSKWGSLDMRKSVPQAVQSLGYGDSGWSQRSRIVPGKAVLFLFLQLEVNIWEPTAYADVLGELPGYICDAHWCFTEEPKFLLADTAAWNVRLFRTADLEAVGEPYRRELSSSQQGSASPSSWHVHGAYSNECIYFLWLKHNRGVGRHTVPFDRCYNERECTVSREMNPLHC